MTLNAAQHLLQQTAAAPLANRAPKTSAGGFEEILGFLAPPLPLISTVSLLNLTYCSEFNLQMCTMKFLQSIARKIAYIFLAFVLVYLGLGLGFHIKWKRALNDCRELRMARGEFVEPEVFGNFIGVAFDVTFWLVYARANIYHFGTPFSTPCTHPELTQTGVNNPIEEDEIRYVVENFGKKLQAVSLQSPNVAQEMKEQYSEFVTPALYEQWMSDVSITPGRMVSSPWPDRIEITTLAKAGSDKYVVSGFVVEVTSMEVVNGGVAACTKAGVLVRFVNALQRS